MSRKRMRGVYVVEFAIIGLLLFTLLFGVLEMGRLYFTVGTLNEVVRRGRGWRRYARSAIRWSCAGQSSMQRITAAPAA